METQDTPTSFHIMVDDFEVQYTTKGDVDYLLSTLTSCKYVYTTDWKGRQYCGITMEWNYKAHMCIISVPGYIKKSFYVSNTRLQQSHKIRHSQQRQYNMEKVYNG